MSSEIAFSGWIAAGLSSAVLAGTAGRTMIADNDIALWRGENGQARAWHNRCPHRGMRLSFGFVRKNRLSCLYHGWSYDGEGGCAAIPAHPEMIPPRTVQVPTYRVVEHGGLIWVAADTAISSIDFPGEWQGCRSLHLNGTVSLEMIGARVEGLIPLGQAGLARLAFDAEGEVLLAVQPLGAHGTMLHLGLSGAPTASRLQAVSDWGVALRRQIEAQSAMTCVNEDEH